MWDSFAGGTATRVDGCGVGEEAERGWVASACDVRSIAAGVDKGGFVRG